MSQPVSNLQRQRAGYRAVVTKLLSDDMPSDSLEIKSLITKIEKYASTLERLDGEILALLPEDQNEADVAQNWSIQDNLISVRGKLESSLPVGDSGQSVISGSTMAGSKKHARLPKLELAKFKGDPLEWTSFWDSYSSAVHTNPDLMPVDKFNYLKGLVTGNAATSIAGFACSNANYDKAIDLLIERYGRKQVVINAHIEALLAIPVAKTLSKLRDTYDEAEKHIRGLEALGITADTYGVMMAPMLMSKIPAEVRLILSRFLGDSAWDLDKLRAQLKIEIEARERSQISEMGSAYSPNVKKPDSKITTGSLVRVAKVTSCAFCKGEHRSSQCPLDLNERWNRAKAGKHCFMCMGQNHRGSECKYRRKCTQCSGWHHIALCSSGKNGGSKDNSGPVLKAGSSGSSPVDGTKPGGTAVSVNRPSGGSSNSKGAVNSDHGSDGSTPNNTVTSLNAFAIPFQPKSTTPVLVAAGQLVIMQTALAPVFSDNRKEKVRILFDGGSQRSFITRAVADRLGLKANQFDVLALASFGASKKKTRSYPVVTLGISCLDGTVQNISAIIVPTITTPLHRAPVPMDNLGILTSLPLADPPPEAGSATASLDEQVQQFWKVETLGIESSTKLQKEPDVLACFEQTLQFEKGRYVARFPWKDNFTINSNRQLALGRLQGLLRRLSRDPALHKDYDAVIRNQLDRGFIEQVPDEQSSLGVVHYIPHHPVVKRERATTKVRIVYDASARMNSGALSLNECLHKGPDLLGDLIGLLIRFRMGSIGLCSDIEKAFLQVGLDKLDQDCTRFFWVDDLATGSEVKPVCYKFVRVSFGVISSPFLLNATIRHHLKLQKSPVSELINRSIYVDNVICSINTEEEAIGFYYDSKSIFSSAGMNLREWSSNNARITSIIPPDDSAQKTDVKVLGIIWDTINDTLQVRSLPEGKVSESTGLTTRFVLHTISLIFDPLGIISPVTVLGKMFMQVIWSYSLDWDAPLPKELCTKWHRIVEQFHAISSIKIPRWIGCSTLEDIQIHVFADASQNAYGSVAYLRMGRDQNIRTNLLCSKTRVAPLDKQTLPRLELLAVLTATRLAKCIMNSVGVPTLKTVIWTDSQIVLAWIFPQKPLKQFVSNRIKEIRENDYAFRHVPTADNPADILSRGLGAAELSKNKLWWNGPPWLSDEEKDWPASISNGLCQKVTPEVITCPVLNVEIHEKEAPFGIELSRHSSLNRLLRVTAWCLRFIRNLQHSRRKHSGSLMPAELLKARNMWVKYSQIGFSKQGCPEKDLVQKFGLYQDEEGIMYCKGRLCNANLPNSTKYPMLLPKNHHFTNLIKESYHRALFHQGVRQTLTAIRSEYWIISGRQQVQRILHRCVTCKLWEGRSYCLPEIPPLPPIRVTESFPFTFTGVDFAGPLYVCDANSIGTKKAWICLFTCAVTRALHLELVESMSAQDFIQCLRRFISRRGAPTKFISDNAKTFKLAKSFLQHTWESVIAKDEVVDYCSMKGIAWQFNVERAPWWGGFFERMVGLVKRRLKKSIGKQCLSFVQLETQLIEIEGILNSRPLTYVYSDIIDGYPLSPNNLCGVKSSVGFPPMSVESEDPDYRISSPNTVLGLTKYTLNQQKITDEFWKMWRHEYLTSLREYNNNVKQKQKESSAVKIGDIVLLKENLPRAQWKLGIIQQLIVGRDGNVRAATVKVGKTIFQRPISLLFPLEVSAQISQRDEHDVATNSMGSMSNYAAPDINSNNQPLKNESESRPKRKAAIQAMIKISKQTEAYDEN